MIKSANQLWRESHSTLSFKEWLNREKEKYANFNGEGGSFIPNFKLQNKITETLDEIKRDTGFKTDTSKNKVFGLDKRVFIVAGVLIVGAIGFRIYLKYKK
jgi:hypothetical protein